MLTTQQVDDEIKIWMSGEDAEGLSPMGFKTVASWFMTSSPGNQFSLVAHGQSWDPLTLGLQIITELKARDADIEGKEDDTESLKSVVYLAAMMAFVVRTMAENHYDPEFFTE